MGRADHGRKASRRAIASWIMFDWATQPWFTLVTTFVFGPYFTSRLAADPVHGQALWGYAAAAAGLVIAACSPVLGAIADTSGARKPWIAGFSVMIVAGSVGLWFAAPGRRRAIAIAIVAFAVGTIGTEFATVFTNAMMPDLVDGAPARAALRHRLGGRLCRRAGVAPPHDRLHGRRSRHRQDAPWRRARLRPRPGALRGRPRLRPAHRGVVPRLRHPALPVHAGCPAAHERRRSTPARPSGTRRDAPRASAATPMRPAISSPT